MVYDTIQEDGGNVSFVNWSCVIWVIWAFEGTIGLILHSIPLTREVSTL